MDKNSICSHKNVHNLVTVNYWPLVDTVGYSIQTCWLLQFLLKPLVTSYIYSSDPTFISRWKFTQSSLGYKVHEMNSNESFLTLILVSRMLRFDSSNHYKNYTRVLSVSVPCEVPLLNLLFITWSMHSVDYPELHGTVISRVPHSLCGETGW